MALLADWSLADSILRWQASQESVWSNKLSSLPVNAAGAAKDSGAVTADYESAEKKAG